MIGKYLSLSSLPTETGTTWTPRWVHATASLLVLLLAAFLTTTPLTTASLTTTSFYLGQGLKNKTSYTSSDGPHLAPPHLIPPPPTTAPPPPPPPPRTHRLVGGGRAFESCSPVCPGTHFVDQTGLELRNPPASTSQVLGLKACTTTPG